MVGVGGSSECYCSNTEYGSQSNRIFTRKFIGVQGTRADRYLSSLREIPRDIGAMRVWSSVCGGEIK